MKIILVRHAQTKQNKEKVIQGWLNSKLSKVGIQQAKKVAKHLKNEKISAIYSSDLDRAKDTAKEIIKHHPHLELKLKKELREQNKGIFEGTPLGTSQKVIDNLGILWHEFKPENGESYRELLERALSLYKKLKKKHNEKESIVIVTHGGVLSTLLAHLEKGDLGKSREYHHDNAAISILTTDEKGKEKIILLNSKEHLT